MTLLPRTLSLAIARCLHGLTGRRRTAPLRLDFAVPKRRRLDWIRRTMDHLPG